MEGMEFKNEIWDLIRLVSVGMDHVFRPIVEPCGLTMMQTRILMEIARSDSSTVGNLAGVVGLSSGNASTLFKKLEQSGFIKRIRDSHDERVVKLLLTELGAETVQKIDRAIQTKYAAILAGKSSRDLAVIIAGMRKLNEILTEMETQIRKDGSEI
jgi:DNA-binding MarR family transcriptional regulator